MRHGVTLLAFGNGASDVFTAIAAVGNSKNGDAGLAFGALIGAAFFISTVVAGAICIVKPFTSIQRPLLRDIVFFLMAAFLVFIVLWDGYISIIEASCFFVLYLIYIIIVLCGRLINKKLKATDELEQKNEFKNKKINDDVEENESTALMNASVFSHALKGLSVVSRSEWNESNALNKAIIVLKAPALFILKLTVPLIDYDEVNQGWNKFLALINCLLAPSYIVFSTGVAFMKLSVIPVWALALISSLILIVLTAFATQWNKQPRFHRLFSYLGFVVSVIWTYNIANEIVNILTTFGVVLNISNTILGLTLLAWGNSLNDLVSDVVSARQGFPNMGISACFGGPLFNILLGTGIPFTIQCIKNKKGFTIKKSLLQDALVAFLMLSLSTTLVFVVLNKFNFSRRYGLFLLALYSAGLLIFVLIETNLIK